MIDKHFLIRLIFLIESKKIVNIGLFFRGMNLDRISRSGMQREKCIE